MSNNVSLQILLRAVDQASRPFKSIQAASRTLSAAIGTTQNQLQELNGQAAQIEGFRHTRAQVTATGQALEKARQDTAALAIQLKMSGQPTLMQAQAMDQARKSTAALEQQHISLRLSLQRQRQELGKAGINTRTLVTDERRVRTSVSETTVQLERQQTALTHVNAQRTKITQISDRYQAGKALADKVSATGAASMTVAKTGLALLKPGYDAAQKNAVSQGRTVMETASGSVADAGSMLTTANGHPGQPVTLREDNLGGDLAGLQSAYEVLSTQLFAQQESSLRGLVQSATNFMLTLDGWIQRNQGLAQTIGVITTVVTVAAGAIGGIGMVAGPVIGAISGIIAVAGLLGTVSTTVFGGIIAIIGAVSWPVIAAVAAIAAGALLVRKYWEPLSAIFGGVMQGIIEAFAPFEGVISRLQPVFDWLGEKLQAVWQWFADLIAPVKATQDTLASCRDFGLMVGQALSAAFFAPLNIVTTLWDKASGLLESLGLVKKESAELEKVARSAPSRMAVQPVLPTFSSETTAISANTQPWQPVKAPAGNSSGHIDNSSTALNFYLNAPPEQGQQLRRQIISILEEHERNKSINQNSAMRHNGG